MTKILEKMYSALTLGAILALAVLIFRHGDVATEAPYWGPFFTYLHVLSGILWIGLLYYFNMVQIPTMPSIPAELKPAVGKYIAPEALFWFRWSALATVITGAIVATLNGYIHEALTLAPGMTRTIGIGMWLGLIMAFNVWFIIWPNQKKVIGLVEATADEKTKAARIGMLTSRTNTLLSIPMLYCMAAQSHGGF